MEHIEINILSTHWIGCNFQLKACIGFSINIQREKIVNSVGPPRGRGRERERESIECVCFWL